MCPPSPAGQEGRQIADGLQHWEGGFDYLLKTRVSDMAAYRSFVGEVIWTLPGVRETRTYAVMEEVKNSTALAF